MASSIFGKKSGGNSILDMIRNPSEAVSLLRNSGAKCTLPDGRQVGIDEFAAMMQGKSPEQAFRENGKDFSQFQNIGRQ